MLGGETKKKGKGEIGGCQEKDDWEKEDSLKPPIFASRWGKGGVNQRRGETRAKTVGGEADLQRKEGLHARNKEEVRTSRQRSAEL